MNYGSREDRPMPAVDIDSLIVDDLEAGARSDRGAKT
jgi:hypothetical protein